MTSTVWRFEDGGPLRTQSVPGRLGIEPEDSLAVTTRTAPVTTMVVGGSAPGELFLLRHGTGEGAVAFVERVDPHSLEPLAASAPLAGGPVWPGGIGVHDNGSVYVVFGNHAHRLDADLSVRASLTLPRARPYNSFVALPDRHLVTKDFGGSLPGAEVPASAREPCELVVLDPDLEIVERLVMEEPSIARLSADGDTVYVVGDTSLMRARWDGARLVPDGGFVARYRTMDGQTYGWDCVIAAGAAWFLDDGDGSERYTGTLRGRGVSTAPLHLVRVDLATADVSLTEICGLPGGLVANPPVIDERRRLAVGFDSGNGVIAAFDLDTLALRWRCELDHGSHMLLYEASGELVVGDAADVVVLDIESGRQLARADTGSGVQSVLFPAPGWERDFYICSFMTVTRVQVRSTVRGAV